MWECWKLPTALPSLSSLVFSVLVVFDEPRDEGGFSLILRGRPLRQLILPHLASWGYPFGPDFLKDAPALPVELAISLVSSLC